MTPDDPRHGQERGYFAHKKAGQTACADCLRAHSLAEKRRVYNRTHGRGHTLDVTGTRRRIQALMALGWTQGDIARAAGFRRREQIAVILNRQKRVAPTTAARIRTAYDALSMRPIELDAQRTRVRNHAQSEGWAVPLAWEGHDIDDPDTQPYRPTFAKPDHDDLDPVVVERILAGDMTLARDATRAEREAVAAAWRDRTGRPLNDLARATGWKTERYTTHHRKEHAA